MASLTNFVVRRAAEGEDVIIIDPKPADSGPADASGAQAMPGGGDGMEMEEPAPEPFFRLEGRQQKTAVAQEEAGTVVASAKLSVRDLDEAENDSERKPLDLVVVLDTSGSMGGAKLRMCQETLAFLLSELTDKDRFALVDYNSGVHVALPLRHADDVSKSVATSTIQGLSAGGSTNLSGGLFKGMSLVMAPEELRRNPHPEPADPPSETFGNVTSVWKRMRTQEPEKKAEGAITREAYDGDEKRVRSVLLLTDGQANDGITDPFQLATAATAMLRGTSISLHTFGYGNGHNGDLLQALAESGRGSYYFLETSDQVPNAFSDCLGGLLTVVAQNVELRIQPQAPYTVRRVISKRKVTEAEGARTQGFTVEIGDLYAGETVDFLVELACPARPESVEAETLLLLAADLVNLRAAPVGMEHLGAALSIARPSELSTAQLEYSDKDLIAQLLRLETVVAMEEATRLADQQDYTAAQARLEAARSSALSAVDELGNNDAAEEQLDLVRALASDLHTTSAAYGSEATFQQGGRHRALNMQANHSMQRGWSPSVPTSYTKSGKSRMMAKASLRFD